MKPSFSIFDLLCLFLPLRHGNNSTGTLCLLPAAEVAGVRGLLSLPVSSCQWPSPSRPLWRKTAPGLHSDQRETESAKGISVFGILCIWIFSKLLVLTGKKYFWYLTNSLYCQNCYYFIVLLELINLPQEFHFASLVKIVKTCNELDV